MREVILFCEDSFHEKFVGAIFNRLAREYSVAVKARFLSARGGLPRMQGEFKGFLRDLARERQPYPDSVIVVVDSNCHGYNSRKAQMDEVLTSYPQFQQLISYAIPDPHIEKWMLVDPLAFRTVFGRGCTLPASKCAKDEYKNLLRLEIRNSGIDAPLGGEEFAEDIVASMDLSQAEIREATLGIFLRDLRAQLNRWKTS